MSFYQYNKIMKYHLISCLLFVLTLSSCATDPLKGSCDPKQLEFSKISIDLNDKDFLTVIMGHSYGRDDVENFIPDLISANSNMYYKDSIARPLMTFFSATYNNLETAEKAYEHLKKKWIGNPNNQYDVVRSGLEVVWYGNNRLESSCFYKIAEIEKAKIL